MSAAFLKLVLFRIEPYSYNAQIHTFLSRRFMHSHVTHNAYRQKKYTSIYTNVSPSYLYAIQYYFHMTGYLQCHHLKHA